MLITGVLCVCAALSTAGFGAWSLSHTRTADATSVAVRAMGPTQLAAAVMLAAGGVVALAASPHTALVLVIVSVAGALGTLAAGSWQSARYTLRRKASSVQPGGCAGNCAVCSSPCH
ncbi:MAG: hypothetical protein JO236_10745 [Mycobacterium sp.]|uniref:hypothetical protein n=1 Tax=Mycobacterium sp. TaxID=1785 RepID=UPI001ED49047|nr:hypothetical protein [Mycobacterium sp.]MBW0018004.1 hypothetical protein [Mycobacterium sp.]